MRHITSISLALCAVFWTVHAHAIEFRAIQDEVAVLFDGPSTTSGKSLVLTRGYPVEIIIDTGDWVRVRDDQGSFAWIESARLSNRRTVLVTVELVTAYQQPRDASPVVFKAGRGVVLEFTGVSGGWANVKHANGIVGFVRLTDLWGV